MGAGTGEHRLPRGLRRGTSTACRITWCTKWWRFARRRRRWRSCTKGAVWRRMCVAAAGEKAVTNQEHRPKSHQAHLEWPPSRMVQWAGDDRPTYGAIIREDPGGPAAPGNGGIADVWGSFGLAKKYSHVRMEAAAERALLSGACRYRSIASILQNSLDRQPLLRRRRHIGANGRASTARQHSWSGVLRVSHS